MQILITKLIDGSEEIEGYTYVNNTLRYHGKLYVGNNGDLRHKIFQELHISSSDGHYGIRATVKRITKFFHWPNLSADITKAVQECLVCQRDKGNMFLILVCCSPIPFLPSHGLT